jgi:hypothetical protein
VPLAARAVNRLRRRSSRLAQRALRHLEPNRTLVLTEYPTRPRPMWGWQGKPVNPWLAELLETSMPAVADLAVELNDLVEWCATVPKHPGPGSPLAWENPSWAPLDAVMQVHALRQRRCATYLEVGSGYSTMFARRAIEDFGLPTRIVSVDPRPRAEIDAICDQTIRQPFEDVAPAVLDLLEPGDVFVFDGSHLATMASDATVLFTGPLGGLPAGVLLGIDDIYLPADYHPTWTGRWYGEQYLVAAWLLGGHRGWEVRLPGWHATDPARGEDHFAPLWPVIEAWGGPRGTCLWIESTGSEDGPAPAR